MSICHLKIISPKCRILEVYRCEKSTALSRAKGASGMKTTANVSVYVHVIIAVALSKRMYSSKYFLDHLYTRNERYSITTTRNRSKSGDL